MSLGNGAPVVDAGPQGIRADSDLFCPDCVNVNDVRQICDVSVEVVVPLHAPPEASASGSRFTSRRL